MHDKYKITRGSGLLEPILAYLRARIANKLIPDDLRRGRLLDIGCGSYPYFLSHTYFKEKFGIDQHDKPANATDINWYNLNLNIEPKLPFEDNYFSVVSMLAVVEHLDPTSLVILFSEVFRTLIHGGVMVITTPAAWSDSILRSMANLRLVSKEEINDHVYAYTLPLLGWYFGKAGFRMDNIKFGYFELNLNMWAMAMR
jgi:SAM-dependent methyltransferase